MTDWSTLQFCKQLGRRGRSQKKSHRRDAEDTEKNKQRWTALFRILFSKNSIPSDKSFRSSEILQFVDIRPPMPQMSGFGGAPDIRRRKINLRYDVAMAGIFIVQQDLALRIRY